MNQSPYGIPELKEEDEPLYWDVDSDFNINSTFIPTILEGLG